MDIAFGDFRLESEGRRLLRRGEYVHLSRKAYELLELLVISRPHVYSKSELQERLWPTTFVVEANVSNLVAEIRVALCDDPRHPCFIRTVYGIGYAFSADAVERMAEEILQPAKDSLCWLICGERQVQLGEGDHLIGRHPASILRIDSPTVSRHHAAIRVTAEEAILTDLGSRNGTYVQGKRIEVPTALADGDKIQVGSVVFAFSVASMGTSTADIDVSSLKK